MLRQGKTGLAVLAFFLTAFPVLPAGAAGVRVDAIPSLRLEERWESNVYDRSADEVSSLGTRVAPGLALRFTAPDDVKLQFSGTYERTWYLDSEAKDANDSTWNLRVESSGAWKLTPTLSVRPSAYYLRTPDSYSRVQLLPTGDPTLPPVTITNYGTTQTNEFGGALAVEYLASPNLSIGINGNYSKQEFPGDNTVGFDLTNASQYGGGLSIAYLVSPRSRLGLTGSVNHQKYDFRDSTDTYFAGIQFGYQFTPVIRLDASVGGSQVRLSEEGGTEARKESSPAGSFILAYRTPDSVGRFYGSAVYSGGSGFGETTQQWTLGLAYTNNISREWSWNLTGAYQIEESVFNTDSVKINKTFGKAGIGYQPWEWIVFTTYATLDRQKSDGQLGDTINSYSAVLGVTIGKPQNIF